MPRSLRGLVLPLLLLFLVPIEAAGQPARPGDLAGIVLEPDAHYASHLDVARERIGKKDWAVAVTLLQKLLDLPGERFAVVTKDGKETVVTLRLEAERLLADLPKEGHSYYEKEVGPHAADLLKRARTLNEPAMLAEVVHRYLLTKAGLEAALRLGAHHVDAGRMRQAAVVYDALHRRRFASPPRLVDDVTLYKAARAYHAAGDNARVAEVLKALEEQIDKEGLKLGKRTLTLADIKKELKKQPRKAPEALASWPMFRGDASRSAQGIGGTAFLEPRWRFDTWRETDTKRHLDKAVEALRIRKRPALPAMYPLSATLARKDRKIPLMIYRDFWGIHTRPLHNVGDPKSAEFVKAGDIFWEAPSYWSIDRMLREPKHVGLLNNWIQTYLSNGNAQSALRPEALFENSVIGSLSTDNVRVYAVEDFQVTPCESPHNRFNRPGVGGGPGGKVGEAMHHNALQAYDLEAGKLLWEVGGKGSKAPNDLLDSFFLAPPLPLNGKLLVPVEKKGELHVVTLQPETGKVLDWLRLAAVRDKATDSPLRRSHAAHLAYADGVLVCPTNAGTILGVDLKARSVLWAYGYRAKDPTPAPPWDRFGRIPPPGMMYTEDGRLVPLPAGMPGWWASAPILRDGKVVFTAPDGQAVHCLRLRNGQPRWRHPRQDGDLYVGGVLDGKVLIVGSKTCRALDLDNGKVVWRLDTGVPSGMGIAAGNRYFLPLKEAIKTREPEICIIDVTKGQVFAHTRSRRRAVPGNLLLFDDSVLSLSLMEVAAYPQLAKELKRIDALLAKNEKDPQGLAMRGDLRLDQGNLKGAAEDYRTALKQNVKGAFADKLRTRLYEALVDYCRQDFNAAEKYLADFEAVCRLKVPPGAAWAEMQRVRAERARRLGNYYALLGQGREQQKKFVEAAKAYLDMLELGHVGDLMEAPGDEALKVSPSVWVRGRLGAVMEKATPKEREQIEKEIERRLKQGKEKTDHSLRRLLAVAGVNTATGRAARAELAKRLAANNDFLGAELLLLQLRRQRHDLPAAARAVEALAELCIRQGLTDDALVFYRELDRDFARVVVRDGKTGAQLFDAIATDKRFLTALDRPPRFLPGIPFGQGREVAGSYPLHQSVYELDQEGEKLPYFRRYLIGLRSDYSQVKVLDRAKLDDARYEGEFTTGLEEVNVPKLLGEAQRREGTEPRLRYANVGHLVVLPVGHKVFAFDPVGKRLLWQHNLLGPSVQSAVLNVSVDPYDDSTQLTYANGWVQRLGLPGLVTPDAVVLQTPDGLTAVDPFSGEFLWSRSGLPRRADVFGDGQHLFVVGLDSEGRPQTSQALRVADGTSLRVPAFAALYRERRQLFGGTLVLADTGDKGEVVLRQYDLLTGKDVWSKRFLPKSFVLNAPDDLAGAVEPDGTVAVVELRQHKPVLTARLRPGSLAKVGGVRLVRDANSFYLVCDRPADEQGVGPVRPHLMQGRGFRTVPVDGTLYRFRIGDLRPFWFTESHNQMLLLNRFEESPVVLLAARYERKQREFGVTRTVDVTATRAIDKATGKLLYNKEDSTGSTPVYHTLRVDPGKDIVELVSSTQKVTFNPRRNPPK